MSKHQWFTDLQTILQEGILKLDEPLCKYTATKLGGAADLLVMPNTIEETVATVRYAYEHHIPLLLLGNGSIMVVRDGGVRGLVLHLKNLNRLTVDGTSIHAERGANIIYFSRAASAYCLTGFKFSGSIPG